MQTGAKQVRFQEMLREAAAMQLADLEHFIKQLTQLAEKRKSPDFKKREKELIDKIKNGGPDKKIVERQKELTKKSVLGTMTPEENKEALSLIPIFDDWNVERLKCMIELSEMWETDLDFVLKKLKIQPAPTIYA